MTLRQNQPRRTLSAEESCSRWDKYSLEALEGRHALSLFEQRWECERPVYARVCERIRPAARILEVGCGLGANAVWFATRGYDVVGVDFRPQLVNRARRITGELQLDCSFEVADAFDLAAYRGFDLVISFGMIEHWPRAETVRALREQAATANHVVATVPTPNTRYAGEITDEHFYSRRQLRGLCREAGLSKTVTYSYGAVPSLAYRAAQCLLPGPALEALRALTLRLAMSQAVFGVTTDA